MFFEGHSDDLVNHMWPKGIQDRLTPMTLHHRLDLPSSGPLIDRVHIPNRGRLVVSTRQYHSFLIRRPTSKIDSIRAIFQETIKSSWYSI
jgi:hypothetical protein